MKVLRKPLVRRNDAVTDLVEVVRSSRKRTRKAKTTEAQVALRTAKSLASQQKALVSDTVRSETAPIDLIDLFSGCGGISAGFALFSSLIPAYRLAGALDTDKQANDTFERNLDIVPFACDAHEVIRRKRTWERFLASLDRRPGKITVVAGGPPCQGFSSHRKAINGCEDLNTLFPTFSQIAVRLKCDVVLLENVPELLTTRSWHYYAKAVRTLREDGFVVRTRVYNLAAFGLPQERFRAVTIGMRKPFNMPTPFLRRNQFTTVRQGIGHLSGLEPGVPDPNDEEHVTTRHRTSTIDTIKAVPKDGGRRPLDAGPDCLRRLAVRNGRTGYDDVYGRLWWDRPAVTITGYSRNPASGRFVHPSQDRGLSIREAALLQGFPPNYKFCGSFDGKFMQIGNAVPASFVSYLAGHILSELLLTREHMDGVELDITEPVGSSFSRLIAGIKKGLIEV